MIDSLLQTEPEIRTVGQLTESYGFIEHYRGTAQEDRAILRSLAVERADGVDALRRLSPELSNGLLIQQRIDLGRHLSRVDGEIAEMSIAEFAAAIEAMMRGDEDEYVGPFSPAEWRKRFGDMSESTWRREIKKMRVDKITAKSLRIHRDDVTRYEKNQP